MTIVARKQREQVVGVALGCGDFYGLRAATPSLATLTGSFRTNPAAGRGELQLQRLVAALLTCGSATRDQFEVAELLESRGASLSIDSELNRISFSARACSADMPLVVELLSECLREPRFDAESLRAEQARLIAELHYYASEPSRQAFEALSRRLYPPGHIRHQPELASQIAHLEGFTIDDVRRYHREQFGPTGLCVVAVGDLDPLSMASELDHRLAGWSSPTPTGESVDVAARESRTDRDEIPAPGYEHFELALGHRLAIGCDHPDYPALWLANHIVGGSYSSRLVTAVRERQGLSYSIHSALARPYREFDGHWQVGLSLGPDQLEAGLAATRAEIARFVDDGVGPVELAARQLEAIGCFQMRLATLSGLGETILSGAERGWGADYLHRFADDIRGLSVAGLNRTIREQLRPAGLEVSIAGPFAGSD